MELDTDVLDEELDAAPPLKTRRITRRAAPARRPRLVLASGEGQEKKTATRGGLVPDTSEATSSWHTQRDNRAATRFGKLASSWTEGKESPETAGERVEATVSLMHMVLSYYGFSLDASDQNPSETIRVRLLCMCDRIALALGGSFGAGVQLAEALLTASVILLKMWTDQSCHLKLLEWRRADVPRVAHLERIFLSAISFKTHLSHANIYDFASRLRSFDDLKKS
jgi:hypothetical protein